MDSRAETGPFMEERPNQSEKARTTPKGMPRLCCIVATKSAWIWEDRS